MLGSLRVASMLERLSCNHAEEVDAVGRQMTINNESMKNLPDGRSKENFLVP